MLSWAKSLGDTPGMRPACASVRGRMLGSVARACRESPCSPSETKFSGSSVFSWRCTSLIWRCWRVAQLASDKMGTLLCVGVMSMLLFHVFENIGMCIGVMPITGIPLPFISYGGTNLVVNMAGIGLVLNVNYHKSSVDLSEHRLE